MGNIKAPRFHNKSQINYEKNHSKGIWSFFEWKLLGQLFNILCLYMFCRWRCNYQERGRVKISLIGLTIQQVCAYPKLKQGFPISYFLASSYVQWFDVIGDWPLWWYLRIIDHHCLSFLLMMDKYISQILKTENYK